MNINRIYVNINNTKLINITKVKQYRKTKKYPQLFKTYYKSNNLTKIFLQKKNKLNFDLKNSR